ncbi:protein MLP1 homolog isoform X2 [Actinia tenebrosa]|uniref:Protein MLP1 homolog isoform X2 n=1 Tax=Actinia tenebrosa TaxID=6105 RepID=A0A6P8HWN5_ACTTE|nr:protein MLP1 homolog isoform X2 [Actinia tenebrosa]
MSKSRIPALARGLPGPSSRTQRSLGSKQSTNTSKSSNLLHYGFAMGKTKSSKSGIKTTDLESEDNENEEKSMKEDVSGDYGELDSTKANALASDTRMSDSLQDKECGSVGEEGIAPPEKHLNLSETQLNVLSYSLSELADKISPSKTDYFDDEEWDTKQKLETVVTERRNSLGRSKMAGDDIVSVPHSKSPYSRKVQAETKPYLSKQKSFNKKKPLVTSNELNLSDDDKTRSSEIQTDKKDSIDKEELMSKAASPSHQESMESGYNSSWSTSSLSEDFKTSKCSTDTDADVDLRDLNDQTLKDGTDDVDEQLKNETSAAHYEKALQKKISDVEKRINSLILGGNPIDLDTSGAEDNSDKNSSQSQELVDKTISNNCAEDLKDEKDETLTNGFQEESHELKDFNQNVRIEKSKTLGRSRDVDQEISQKSPFHMLKVRKASLDESRVDPKPKRPGLVRRRTTLVTFRAPRHASAFNEVDDSGVLEIDEAGFVQCLTDVRAMKTMLLKLKRELQEAEVVSPLAKSKSISSRSITNLSNLCENDSCDESGVRRNTYDSSEVIHEKLRRIRSASLSRRKQSSCLERPDEEQLAAENSTQRTVEEKRQNDSDEEMKKMKEEMEDLREKMKNLKEERDTLFMDKEEIEHELETKNHTIKLLQKQLEVQENSEEMAYLQRQVAALTYQVRQQQQKITELKYRASTPPNTSRSTSPTNFSTKKDAVKVDIRNRLRDAFVRHLEESSKSHVLLSKHIEKAEFTIGEAQKVGKSSDKAQPSPNLLGTPRTPEETRRHSWTANSIDKIIKTWKDTAKSIENLSSRSTNDDKKSSQLPKPKSLKNPPHMAFL